MQEPLASEKFHLTNLDCATCAAKLEKGLREVAGVSEAVVDFANLTLHVRAENIASVLEAAHRIEPDLILVPHGEFTAPDEAVPPEPRHRISRSMALLLLCSVLFLIVLLFEERFHQKAWFVQEALIVLTAYLLAGANVLAAAWRTVRRGVFFDENVLMVIATGGALAMHAHAEAVGVMLFYKVGEMLQDTAVNRSRRSIRALLAAKPSRATLQTEAGPKHVSPEDVRVGEVIVVKPGEKIPLDGDILSGRSQLDTAALTGEPRPVKAEPGGRVMAGQINKTGTLTINVTRLFRETSSPG